MSYWLEKFGDVYASATALPARREQHDLSSDTVLDGAVTLPGGAMYDTWGTADAWAYGDTITARGAIHNTGGSAFMTAHDNLKALIGTRSKLWAKMADGSSTRWRYARLLKTTATRAIENTNWLDVELTFRNESTNWNGTARSVNGTLDTTPKTVTVTNNGNTPVRNAIITITAAGSSISFVSVSVSGVSYITWAGTLAAGNALVIDCGAGSVKNNGADAYDGFALDGSHTIREWLRLDPGTNTVSVARTGGSTSSTVNFSFSDGWA